MGNKVFNAILLVLVIASLLVSGYAVSIVKSQPHEQTVSVADFKKLQSTTFSLQKLVNELYNRVADMQINIITTPSITYDNPMMVMLMPQILNPSLFASTLIQDGIPSAHVTTMKGYSADTELVACIEGTYKGFPKNSLINNVVFDTKTNTFYSCSIVRKNQFLAVLASYLTYQLTKVDGVDGLAIANAILPTQFRITKKELYVQGVTNDPTRLDTFLSVLKQNGYADYHIDPQAKTFEFTVNITSIH